MNNILIIVCNNKSFGESLAFSLNTIFGYSEHVLHRSSRNLFGQLKDIGITDSVILVEDEIPGLNYPALIDDIEKFQPALQMIIGNKLSSIIAESIIKQLGCDAILSKDTGLKGIVNTLVSWRSGERPINKIEEPLQRLEKEDQEFLKDVYYLGTGEVKAKYKVTQQRVWNRKENLFRKLYLNPDDTYAAFRALGHLYCL